MSVCFFSAIIYFTGLPLLDAATAASWPFVLTVYLRRLALSKCFTVLCVPC